MKSFLKFTLATIVGILALNLIGFIFLMIFVGISTKADVPDVEEHSVLLARFNKPIMDRANDNPLAQFMSGNLGIDGMMGLDQIIKDIEKAKSDENIDGIFLDLSTIPAGMATLEEIRDALEDFRESEKFILAHADMYTQKTYYLASVADKVYMTPTGDFSFSGLSSEVTFFKHTLDKLGIDMQVIRHGSYKSAVEPLMKDELSEENREQIDALITSLWDQMVSGIAVSRSIPEEDLNQYADQVALAFDDQALEKGMLDGLKYYDEVLDELRERTETEEDDDVPAISLKKYKNVPASGKKEPTRNTIAVIYAMGNVVLGDADEGTIGSDRIAKAIRKAREDDKVKAIVFRVNSGGGSSLASEVIYREAKLAAEKKPFVASLGDVAASGGYYIVCPADTIVSSENTITGSTGVFGVLPNMKELMNDKLGITVDVVKTNTHADMGSVFRSLTPEERMMIQSYVDDVYQNFAQRVAEGRNMTYDEVNAIGGGRVWSGEDAMRVGLIDVFGGLDKSIAIAAEMAGLDNYNTRSLPALEDPFTAIMKELSGDIRTRIIKKEMGTSYHYYQQLEEVKNMDGIQARMPFSIYIY